ncbi:MAG: hypothetical protein BRD30_12070 [Bacteroidetes bacterium QH_2_63_10]|nr:MAG: hypothetical protein BRD30_12070 [Bacteroidetes bacterium QH_2_63_10]
MSTRSVFRFDPRAILGSFVIGVVFVVLFTALTGNIFGKPLFPLLAMTSGFILAGVGYGYLSEGETVMEPALAAILVSVVAYFVIEALSFKAFGGLDGGSFTYMMIIAFLNGLVLTFAGAWAGETLQRTYAQSGESILDWGWIMTGTILGFAVSLFLTNFVIWLFGALGEGPGAAYAALEPSNVWVMLFVVFLGLEATGYVCAFRSPGDTSYEAAIAGIITLVLLIDVFVFALGGQSILTYSRMILVLVIGLLASLVGGYIGERMQARAEGTSSTA